MTEWVNRFTSFPYPALPSRFKSLLNALTYSNQNAIVINIICLYSIKDGKCTMKLN